MPKSISSKESKKNLSSASGPQFNRGNNNALPDQGSIAKQEILEPAISTKAKRKKDISETYDTTPTKRRAPNVTGGNSNDNPAEKMKDGAKEVVEKDNLESKKDNLEVKKNMEETDEKLEYGEKNLEENDRKTSVRTEVVERYLNSLNGTREGSSNLQGIVPVDSRDAVAIENDNLPEQYEVDIGSMVDSMSAITTSEEVHKSVIDSIMEVHRRSCEMTRYKGQILLFDAEARKMSAKAQLLKAETDLIKEKRLWEELKEQKKNKA
ncbi:hypothetical protein BGZ76_003406 [Entomortierella beljakovae]|nr:hypothetical protein BGZ76_003406 [Entomortierella beljakovae]